MQKYNGFLRSFKRLNGFPFLKKFCYVVNALAGETLRIRTVGTLGLRLVEISLTDRCQCRCGHCFAATSQPLPEKDELTTTEVMALLDDLAESCVTEVCFSGGEPLLRRDILSLIAYARKKYLVVRLITNGILLNEEMVIGLKHAGLTWCSLSIDSPVAAEHDAFRKYPGCFDKAITGLELLIKHDIACSIITVARKELIHSGELEEIVKLGQRIGVTVVRINFPVPIGRYSILSKQTLTLEEREEVRKLLRYGNVTMEAPNEGTRCTAGVTKTNILPDGQLTPCVFVPLAYGNIRERGFLPIWKTCQNSTRSLKFADNVRCVTLPCVREYFLFERYLHFGQKTGFHVVKPIQNTWGSSCTRATSDFQTPLLKTIWINDSFFSAPITKK